MSMRGSAVAELEFKLDAARTDVEAADRAHVEAADAVGALSAQAVDLSPDEFRTRDEEARTRLAATRTEVRRATAVVETLDERLKDARQADREADAQSAQRRTLNALSRRRDLSAAVAEALAEAVGRGAPLGEARALAEAAEADRQTAFALAGLPLPELDADEPEWPHTAELVALVEAGPLRPAADALAAEAEAAERREAWEDTQLAWARRVGHRSEVERRARYQGWPEKLLAEALTGWDEETAERQSRRRERVFEDARAF